MAGITPLISQVPANAPTNNKIKIAPVTDLRLSATLSSMVLYEILLAKPTTAATAPPKRRINWLEPDRALSP